MSIENCTNETDIDFKNPINDDSFDLQKYLSNLEDEIAESSKDFCQSDEDHLHDLHLLISQHIKYNLDTSRGSIYPLNNIRKIIRVITAIRTGNGTFYDEICVLPDSCLDPDSEL